MQQVSNFRLYIWDGMIWIRKNMVEIQMRLFCENLKFITLIHEKFYNEREN